MDENVLRWITKITNAFAECSCGEMCHIDVTIREREMLFRAICPQCHRTYTVLEHIFLVKNAKVDLTDNLLEKVRSALKQPYTAK